MEAQHDLAHDDEKLRGRTLVFEVRIQHVHLEESILSDEDRNRIDPDKWRPLIMSFQHFYGLGPKVLRFDPGPHSGNPVSKP